MGRGRKRPSPKSNLRDDLNKLIAPSTSKKTQTLAPRPARAPIEQRQGSGREGVPEGTGVAARDIQGLLTSSDGAFVIYYDYHVHDEQ